MSTLSITNMRICASQTKLKQHMFALGMPQNVHEPLLESLTLLLFGLHMMLLLSSCWFSGATSVAINLEPHSI